MDEKYLQEIYKDFQSRYGASNIIPFSDFTKKITTDSAYARQTYDDLANTYGKDNILGFDDFYKKVKVEPIVKPKSEKVTPIAKPFKPNLELLTPTSALERDVDMTFKTKLKQPKKEEGFTFKNTEPKKDFSLENFEEEQLAFDKRRIFNDPTALKSYNEKRQQEYNDLLNELEQQVLNTKTAAGERTYVSGEDERKRDEIRKEAERVIGEKNNLKSSVGAKAAELVLNNFDLTNYDPKDVGREIIKIADPELEAQFKLAEQDGGSLPGIRRSELERIGIDVVKNHLQNNFDLPNREQALQLVNDYEADFDTRNFELTASRVRDKLSQYFYKKDNSGLFGYSQKELKEAINDPKLGLTPAEKQVAESYVLPLEDKIIGTDIAGSGFLRSFKNALEQSSVNTGNTLADIVGLRDESDQAYDVLSSGSSERFGTVKNRSKWSKFKDGTGNLTGQVAEVALLGKGIGMTGRALKGAANLSALGTMSGTAGNLLANPTVGLYITGYLNSYDNYKQQAIRLMPLASQADEREAYAKTMAAVEGLSERIFNDVKILKAFSKEVAPTVANITSKLLSNQITKEAAQQSLKNSIVKFGKEFGKSGLQNASEESIVDLADGVATSVYGDKGFDIVETGERAVKTFASTLLYSGLVSGLAARGAMRNSDAAFLKSSIIDMAKDPANYIKTVEELKINGAINEAQAQEKIKLIQSANKFLTELPEGKFDYPQATSYIVHRLNEQILTDELNKLSDNTDPVIKRDLQDKIKRSEEIRKGLYEGTVDVTEDLEEVSEDGKKLNILSVDEINQPVTEQEKKLVEDVDAEIENQISDLENQLSETKKPGFIGKLLGKEDKTKTIQAEIERLKTNPGSYFDEKIKENPEQKEDLTKQKEVYIKTKEKVAESLLNSQSDGQQEAQISQRVPQEKLGSGNEAYSRIKEISTRLQNSPRAGIEESQRPEELDKKIAFDYAKESGIWVDDLYLLGEPMKGGGNENTLAYKDGAIYKSNNLMNYGGSLSKFLQSVNAHNELFPESKYELVGFTGFEKGKDAPYLEPILKQDFVSANQATQAEIDAHMSKLGFEKVNDHTFRNKNYEISDLRPRNVLKDENGIIYIIDDIIKLITKDFTEINEEAKSLGFDNGTHAINSVNKRLEKKYDKFEDIPKEELKQVSELRKTEENLTGLRHADTDTARKEMGLAEREIRKVKADEKLYQDAEDAIKDGYNVSELADKIYKEGHLPTDLEHVILVKYAATLEARIAKERDAEKLSELIREVKRIYEASESGGSELGAALRARQARVLTEDSLSSYFVQDMEASGVNELTDEQRDQAIKEFENITKAKEEYEEKLKALQEENARLRIENEIASAKKNRTKRSKEEFATERQAIVNDIKEKLRQARSELSVTPVPYAKELIAIAPDVSRLVRNLVQDGVTRLEDVVSEIHDILKDGIKDITEADVRNLIAGEYNEKKKTVSEINKKLYELKQKAKLVNRLVLLQHSVEPFTEAKKIERNREIAELQKKIKEHDRTKLVNLKKNIRKQIENLEEDLKTGNFEKAKPKPFELDKEAIELKDKLISLRTERKLRLARMEMARRTPLQKAKDVVTEIVNTPRSIMSSLDFSAPFRQGLLATVSHPKLAAKSFKTMFKHAFSEKEYDRWFYDLRQTHEFRVMEESGLYVSDPKDLRLAVKEEQFMSNLAERIPVIGKLVKGSQRAYTSYLNKMRVDLFNDGIKKFEALGKTVENSPELYKGWASYINNATGRGGLGALENSAQILNSTFFSPRLIASRVNLLNPVYYAKLPPEVRTQAIKDFAIMVSVGLTVLALAKAAGAEVEEDPRSADFGKIKIGNTRYDIWGGFQQYIRMFTQVIITGETKSSTSGEIRKLDPDKFPYTSRGGQALNFFRSKLAPIPASVLDASLGKNAVGEKTEVPEELKQMIKPLYIDGIEEAYKDGGFKNALATGLVSVFGIGAQTYKKKD